MRRSTGIGLVAVWFMMAGASRAADMGTAFTYQGYLEKPAGTPVSAPCDFRFGLWDAAAGGALVPPGAPATNPAIASGFPVSNGVFSATIDFGDGSIDGTARWLEIEVRCAGDPGFTALTPRVELTPAPVALSIPGMRTDQTGGSPNVVGGFSGNSASQGSVGATISGGGALFQSTDGHCQAGFGTLCAGDADCTQFPPPTCVPDASVGRCDDSGALCDSGQFPCQTGNCILPPVPNQAFANYVSIGGGSGNVAGGDLAVTSALVPGTGYYSTIGGGANNHASGQGSTVSGGMYNTAGIGNDSTVGGGGGNRAIEYWSTVGGGSNNEASSLGSTVGGGTDNIAGGPHATIGGGRHNYAGSLCVGGPNNGFICVSDSSCPGGACHFPDSPTVGGGHSNVASGDNSAVGGGISNTAKGVSSTIGGGNTNTASATNSTVGGGGGSTASGFASTVPGGQENQAGGDYSFAAGRRAKVRTAAQVGGGDTDGDQGTFVWADAVSTGADFNSTGSNRFLVRASGGMWFGTTSTATIGASRFLDTSTGAYLTTGGTWTNSSDRAKKENIAPVDPSDVLAHVLSIPIARWNYKEEDRSIHHIGPMAQDFHAAFGVGDSDKSIPTIDADGVALAAIQGLYEVVRDKDCRIGQLEDQNSELQSRLAALEALVGKLVSQQNGGSR